MSTVLQEFGIDRLTAQERLQLAEAIWESVAQELEQGLIPAAQRQELERRLADSMARPEAAIPWETVKASALARARP